MARAVRRPRCGWCIDGLHDKCVTVVAMGERHLSPRASKPKRHRDSMREPTAAIWRCGCGCEASERPMCPDCRRTSEPLRMGRCDDQESCWQARQQEQEQEQVA